MVALALRETEVMQVVEACRDHYLARGVTAETGQWQRLSLSPEEVAILDSLPAVVAPSERRVECVLDHTADPTVAGVASNRLAALGWELWVLVPVARMGTAHAVLRGLPLRLQPWWRDGAGVHFGGPEVP